MITIPNTLFIRYKLQKYNVNIKKSNNRFKSNCWL